MIRVDAIGLATKPMDMRAGIGWRCLWCRGQSSHSAHRSAEMGTQADNCRRTVNIARRLHAVRQGYRWLTVFGSIDGILPAFGALTLGCWISA